MKVELAALVHPAHFHPSYEEQERVSKVLQEAGISTAVTATAKVVDVSPEIVVKILGPLDALWHRAQERRPSPALRQLAEEWAPRRLPAEGRWGWVRWSLDSRGDLVTMAFEPDPYGTVALGSVPGYAAWNKISDAMAAYRAAMLRGVVQKDAGKILAVLLEDDGSP